MSGIDHAHLAPWALGLAPSLQESWEFFVNVRPFARLDRWIVGVCAVLTAVMWLTGGSLGQNLSTYIVRTSLRGLFGIPSRSLAISAIAATNLLGEDRRGHLVGGVVWTCGALDWWYQLVPYPYWFVIDITALTLVLTGKTSHRFGDLLVQLLLHWAGIPNFLGDLSSRGPPIFPLFFFASYVGLLAFLVWPFSRPEDACLDGLSGHVHRALPADQYGEAPGLALAYLRQALASTAPETTGLVGHLAAIQFHLRELIGPLGLRTLLGIGILTGYLVPRAYQRGNDNDAVDSEILAIVDHLV